MSSILTLTLIIVSLQEPLEVVALLRQDAGATFTLHKDPHTKQTYSTGVWFLTRDNPKGKDFKMHRHITSVCFISFQQTIQTFTSGA